MNLIKGVLVGFVILNVVILIEGIPTEKGPKGAGCEFNGKSYHDGEAFKDDCNPCICDNGSVGCTKMACVEEVCIHNGTKYESGVRFMDGCQACMCISTTISCDPVEDCPTTTPKPATICQSTAKKVA